MSAMGLAHVGNGVGLIAHAAAKHCLREPDPFSTQLAQFVSATHSAKLTHCVLQDNKCHPAAINKH